MTLLVGLGLDKSSPYGFIFTDNLAYKVASVVKGLWYGEFCLLGFLFA
jgi:hypothetical protein